MLTLILPGYSESNKIWVKEAADYLKLDGQIRPIFWDHWTNPNKKFKPKEKARLLVGVCKGKMVNIIAKSVGTLVAAYIVESIPEQINKIILCGIPTTSEERLKISKPAFGLINPDKITCFQNKSDPFAKPEDVRKFMNKINVKIKVFTMQRGDHHYPYYEDFQRILSAT